MLADGRIRAAVVSDLSNVDTLGTAGQVVLVNAAGTGLSFADAPAATVSPASFSSLDDTVVITTNGNLVDLEARPAWIGNANTAPTGTTACLLYTSPSPRD